MLGYTREELLEMNPLEVETEHPPEEVLEKLRTRGEARFETEHRRKGGSFVPVETNTHIISFQGRWMTIAVVRDITERRRSEKALREAIRKLNLLSSITRHDINNQTVALKGNLALLKLNNPQLSTNEHLKTTERIAEQISAMIRFTKEYEDIGVRTPIWQDAKTLVRSGVRDVSLRGTQIIDDIPEGTTLFADPLIVKVFHNLSDNAARHGGDVSTVRFYLEEKDGMHAIVCEDDGPGIQPDMKLKLFSKGFGKGHGLGLFLSREILAITGILLTEEGEPGKGAKFVLTIPNNGLRGQPKNIY
jgi:signal transduction histidine kinase